MSWARLFRRKPVRTMLREETGGLEEGLQRRLGAFDLTTMGVGAIIGTGIFVLTGVAAARYAGPGAVLSFALAGLASALAALAYAELAAAIPVAGSAYVYSYAALGEVVAWVIGWNLILEYTVAAGAVAIGWSGYVQNALQAAGRTLPPWFTNPPAAGGLVNLPAVLVVAAVAGLLIIGTRESASFNNLVVMIKLSVVLLFIAAGFFHVRPSLWTPFLPFGLRGVFAGASIVFFAYIGFDAVATAAEEVKNPGRDLPRGIIGSLSIASLLYMLVALVVTGLVSYRRLDVPSPLGFALLQAGVTWASAAISVGAITGLSSVILVTLFAQSRIFFAMARDGLLPCSLARLHRHFGTPYRIILLTAGLAAAIGGWLPVTTVAELVNIGTLSAFLLVSLGVITLRYREPDLPRPFKTPAFPLVPLLSAAASLYLMAFLPRLTWLRFLVWLAAGLAIYLLYGIRNSRLAVREVPAGTPLPQPAAKPLPDPEDCPPRQELPGPGRRGGKARR